MHKILGGAVALLLLAGCGGEVDRSVKKPENKDPKVGWVVLEENSYGSWRLRYRCLGSDLLVQAYDESPQVVKDADKCK